MPKILLSCFPKKQSKNNKTVSSATPHESAYEDDTNNNKNNYNDDQNKPILVEIFSSQGCKTSLEAELLISRLGRGDFNLSRPIIILGFHVDYWDYLGWKDPFGSNQWTVRQKAYVDVLKLDTMFTPFVVVQGRAHCVGNDEDVVVDLVRVAPNFPSPNLQVNFEKTKANILQISVSGSLRVKIDEEGANVMVALYENGLITSCSEGENKDQVLSNDYVVRRLEKLISVKDTTPKENINGIVNLPLWESFNRTKCGLVIFVQNNSHQIFGSRKFDLPDNI